MRDDSAHKPAKSAEPHPVTPKNEQQGLKRKCRIEDALEDDEVNENLALLRAKEKAKRND